MCGAASSVETEPAPSLRLYHHIIPFFIGMRWKDGAGSVSLHNTLHFHSSETGQAPSLRHFIAFCHPHWDAAGHVSTSGCPALCYRRNATGRVCTIEGLFGFGRLDLGGRYVFPVFVGRKSVELVKLPVKCGTGAKARFVTDLFGGIGIGSVWQ